MQLTGTLFDTSRHWLFFFCRDISNNARDTVEKGSLGFGTRLQL